jgi:hypothetical protein
VASDLEIALVELPGRSWRGTHMSESSTTFRDFFKAVRDNEEASLTQLTQEIRLLESIHNAFVKFIELLDNTPEYFCGFFVLNAHSAFLGGVRLCLGCQLPEAFPLLRLSIESALYAHFLWKHPEHKDAWLDRDEESRKRVRQIFVFKELMDELEKSSTGVHANIKLAYEFTIDYGAHPNVDGVYYSLRKYEDPTTGNIHFFREILTNDQARVQNCISNIAFIGLAVLRTLQLIWNTRVRIMSLDKEIDRIEKRVKIS